MSPRRNIELKARCQDLARAREVFLAKGAREAGLLLQVDTYFHVRHGRLKLREIEPDRAELIWYDRPDGTESRASDYVVVPVPDPTAMKTALSAALGIRGQIRKHRQLLIWQNVRIHLDDVAELGSFVEFEAVLTPGETEPQGHERLRELSAALGIGREDCVAVSYCDLAGLAR